MQIPGNTWMGSPTHQVLLMQGLGLENCSRYQAIIYETSKKTGYQLWNETAFSRYTHTLTNRAPKTTNIYWDFEGRVLINFLKIATFTRMNCLTTHEFNILNFFEHVLQCFTKSSCRTYFKMFYVEFLHLELGTWNFYIALNSTLFLKFNF